MFSGKFVKVCPDINQFLDNKPTEMLDPYPACVKCQKELLVRGSIGNGWFFILKIVSQLTSDDLT